jgi:CcmD family protein
MYQFLEQNSLYVVMGIVLIIWIGIFIELIRLDKKITKIEKNPSANGY